MLDVPDYDEEKSRPNFVMTLHQFLSYFSEEDGLKHIEDVAAESKWYIVKIGKIWTPKKTAVIIYANNKGTDQPVH